MRGLRGVVVACLGVVAAGCFVQIDHVGDPETHFRAAHAEASRYQGRPGPAHQLNVLVYDPSDHEMVRVSVPMWLARKAAERHIDDAEFDIDLGIADKDSNEHVSKALRRRVKGGDLRQLEKLGLGIVAEVEEGSGERVLVWLR